MHTNKQTAKLHETSFWKTIKMLMIFNEDCNGVLKKINDSILTWW
jgi:hypothetical protein